MNFAAASDGTRLYCESDGTGTPVIFAHEFGGDHRSWEPQIRFLSRRYRCITFAARGFPPSDVPDDLAMYTQEKAAEDIVAVLDHYGIRKAHLVGASMGGFAALHMALARPDRVLSVTISGTGYGAEKEYEAYFRDVSVQVARGFEEQGSPRFARTYAEGASRVQFQNKDPRGWREFAGILSEHSAKGAALTMRGVQARRPSLYDLESALRNLAIPTLVIVGDEDDHCLQPGLFLKRTIPASGLLVVPKTGHTVNLEEPDLFNRAVAEFFSMVEAGRWLPRDPRANPEQIMRTE